MQLHEWVFPLAAWRAMHGLPGGEVNDSSRVVEESLAGIGATIMGRNMFGGHPSPWDAVDLHVVPTLLGSGRTVATPDVVHLEFAQR